VRNKKHSSVVFAKKSSIIATEFALAMMAAQFAYAQQQTEVAAAERVERVEITGTRLPTLSVEGPSPVTVMNAQEIRMDGLTKTEDLLNNLPQVYAAQGTATSNGATGTANVNLRNLGVNRNLVLMNGRRLPPGSPRSGAESYAADLNQIPAPLIQRVEMLTGGASAVYGSDAMSGVVNFIMNDRFEGLQIDYNHTFSNHRQHHDPAQAAVRTSAAGNPDQYRVPDDVTSDGKINSISMLMGRNFADNKGNATVFLSYKKEDPVLQANRDFSACALGGSGGFTCAGSPTSFPGQFLLNAGAGPAVTIDRTTGLTRNFVNSTDLFNFGPYNYFRRPSEQYGLNAFAHLDVHPAVRAYTELSMHDNHTDAQIAPSGSFFTFQSISSDNPLLTPDWRTRLGFTGAGQTHDMFIGRRNIEGGGRDDDIRHTSFRAVAGAKGEVLKFWNYDVFTQIGKVLYQSIYKNDFSNIRIGRALDVITDPSTGQAACRSFVDGTDPNCRPWNIWSLGGVNADALNYLQVPGLQNGRTEQEIQGLTLSADLGGYGLKLPSAKNGVGLAVGFERRREKLQLDTDVSFTTNDLAGQGGATIGVKGALGADEIFGEVRVPIIEGQRFADLLSVSASYRHSEYTTNKNTNTYGVGAEWAPVRNYRFRGSYQHAVRHANITELFQPQGNNLFGMDSDPCGPTPDSSGNPTLPPTATPAQCAQSGITTQYGSNALFNPAGQYNFLQGGNVDLVPEKANTWTLGLVMTPIRNFTATIDYFSIKIDEAIDSAPPESILSQCLENNVLCDRVDRDPATGSLWLVDTGRIVAINENIGGYRTSGIDIAASYTQRLGALGSLGLHVLGTWVHKWEFEPIKGGGRFDCVGLYGGQCGTPNPEWRHKIRLSWGTPWSTDLAVTWRHIGKVLHEGTSDNPIINDTVAPINRTLGSRDYLDLSAQVAINKTFTLRGGVNNVLDRDPPIVSNTVADPSIFGNGNTFPQVYDSLGRVVFINVTAKF
jgi:iron complex outermembrane recepter protein